MHGFILLINMAEDIEGEDLYLKKQMKFDGHGQHFPTKKTNQVAM
jgi:hypothetical protein